MPPTLPARARILVVSLRRIGDVLLTTPLIRSLRRAYPDALVDVLVFRGTEGILKGNPDIRSTIVMPARPTPMQSLRLLARLRRHYHLALSTQTGDRPTLFAVTAGRRRAGLIVGDNSLGGRLKHLMLDYGVPADERVHRVEQGLLLADALGIARVAELVPPAPADRLPFTPAKDYAVIHAAPMFRYKEWTHEGWRALAAGLAQRHIEVVAIGGPGEGERAYLDHIWQGVVTVHQAGWPETVTLLNKARVYIGPDTSVTHLAAATGCPTVALFGPMDPRIWGPWPVGGLTKPWQARGSIQHHSNVWIVQNPLPCLPCTLEGCERRIDSYSVCLDELTAEQVLCAVDQAIA